MNSTLRQLAAGTMVLGCGVVQADIKCSLGTKSCDGTERIAPPQPKVQQKSLSQTFSSGGLCTIPGTWIMPSGVSGIPDYVISVEASLTGVFSHPFCMQPHALTVTPTGLGTFVALASYPPDPICVTATMNLTLSSDCQQATGQGWNNDQPDVIFPVDWQRSARNVLSPSLPFIPSSERVEHRKVLTRSQLVAVVMQDQVPVPGVLIQLQSNRPTADVIFGPSGKTNDQGRTSARVDTRDQTASSVISVTSPDSARDMRTIVSWLPARYEDEFLVTCYVVSAEENFLSTPLVSQVSGLPIGKSYRRGFLADTRMQGTGRAIDGTYIHYEGDGRYSVQSCALTRSGSCAVDGQTVAVDRSIIPLRASIEIESVGQRLAEDTGGRIDDRHIDEFFGTRRAACLQRGRSLRDHVTLLHY